MRPLLPSPVASCHPCGNLPPVPSQAAYPSPASSPSQAAQALDALVSAQLREREEARKSKDFTRADAIRDMLAEAGIIIEDTPHGPTWKL